jgi:hypothetical protein
MRIQILIGRTKWFPNLSGPKHVLSGITQIFVYMKVMRKRDATLQDTHVPVRKGTHAYLHGLKSTHYGKRERSEPNQKTVPVYIFI